MVEYEASTDQKVTNPFRAHLMYSLSYRVGNTTHRGTQGGTCYLFVHPFPSLCSNFKYTSLCLFLSVLTAAVLIQGPGISYLEYYKKFFIHLSASASPWSSPPTPGSYLSKSMASYTWQDFISWPRASLSPSATHLGPILHTHPKPMTVCPHLPCCSAPLLALPQAPPTTL